MDNLITIQVTDAQLAALQCLAAESAEDANLLEQALAVPIPAGPVADKAPFECGYCDAQLETLFQAHACGRPPRPAEPEPCEHPLAKDGWIHGSCHKCGEFRWVQAPIPESLQCEICTKLGYSRFRNHWKHSRVLCDGCFEESAPSCLAPGGQGVCTTCHSSPGYWRWREPWVVSRYLCNGCFEATLMDRFAELGGYELWAGRPDSTPTKTQDLSGQQDTEQKYCAHCNGGISQRRETLLTCYKCDGFYHGYRLNCQPVKFHAEPPPCNHPDYGLDGGYWVICETCGKRKWGPNARAGTGRRWFANARA